MKLKFCEFLAYSNHCFLKIKYFKVPRNFLGKKVSSFLFPLKDIKLAKICTIKKPLCSSVILKPHIEYCLDEIRRLLDNPDSGSVFCSSRE